MQLRVTFREPHESGEATFGLSTTLRAKRSTPTREVLALGINAVQQFRSEVESGYREERSYLRGQVDTPAMDSLVNAFESERGFEQPAARLRQRDHTLVDLWSMKQLLGFESQDAVARVRVEPTSTRELIHSHDHSDRLVMLTKGSGVLHVAPGDARYFPRNLTRFELRPGDVVFMSRGTAHLFFADVAATEALVWHSPYIAHGDPMYQTQTKSPSMASLIPLKEVLHDRLLLSVMFGVHRECTDPVALCRALHVERDVLDVALRRLEALRMLERVDELHWQLHPSIRIEQSDGRLHFVRDEDGVTAEVSAKLRQ